MDDTISRQAAIDAIDVLKRNYPSSCFEDLCKAVDIAIKALSAQPEPRWIPVESEPPEFGKEVLISHKGAVSIDWLTQSEGWAYFFVSGVAIADIDAWMPLPESYRGGENG